MHPFLNEDALTRLADLARVAERAEGGPSDGGLEVGVSEDDGRTVAAQLQQHRLGAGALGDQISSLRAAGEAHGLRTRIADDLVPNLGFFFSSRRRHTRFDCDWSSDGVLFR